VDSNERLDLAIIVLSYNTAELLGRCLRSVYASELEVSWQVCVVDNGSTDGSVDLVRTEFPQAQLIVNPTNLGFSAGNNKGLRHFGFQNEGSPPAQKDVPCYVLLLNADTEVPPRAIGDMLSFMQYRPEIGVAGPRVRRPDGSLDLACRRSFPTPQVSFYRMVGLNRLFPGSLRFNAYNLNYLPEDAVHPVDSVVGAFMMLRGNAIQDAGLLDESFFMYGEDLDWSKRIKDAGWQIWYNGQLEVTHVKEASSSQSGRTRVDFYEAMWIFYRKHYRHQTPKSLDRLIALGISIKGGIDVAAHLWRYCQDIPGRRPRSDEAPRTLVPRSVSNSIVREDARCKRSGRQSPCSTA
jgi:GT2 family glycosyltransferase